MTKGSNRVFRKQIQDHGATRLALICTCSLLLLSACQNTSGSPVKNDPPQTLTLRIAAQQPSIGSTPFQIVAQISTPTVGTTPTQQTSSLSNPVNTSRPVLAFYYTWYTSSTWCSCHMPDLPTILYNSSDNTTIARQVTEAADAGITGFISSWWGPGDQTDTNFARVLAYAATFEKATRYHFASSIYFESDSPHLSGTSAIIAALRYVLAHYSNDAHFFHWRGKPVIFFWDPLGNGRTLATWAYIRSQVDPNNQTIWSAEGVDTTLLSVFDGIHLFSAGYWGIQNGDMTAVDQGFRAKVNAYDQPHQAQKIWAAGVLPGSNDTLIPGRTGTYIVPRNNGATYGISWSAAIASNPDWITITSYNEWFEGSMIEPSVHYGNQYLNLTLQYAKKWYG